jgi:hypothetical protein
MKTFILTDIMKTGHHWWYAQFLRYNSLKDEEIIICEDYYDLYQYNISKFDRRIALICGQHDSKLNSTEYKNDLDLRIAKLKEKGFKFILAHPWECAETAKDNKHIKLFSTISVGTWYGGSNWFWFYMYEKHHNKSFTFDHSVKKYDFLYLNKQKRVHRVSLYNELQTERCLDNSLYSFIGLEKPIRLDPAYELPWIDTNNYPWVGRDQDMCEKPYNESCCNIVSESAVNEIFLTEKIWKPIIAEQMFVVHSSLGYLKTLQGLGFITFNNIIEESYDNETDPTQRIKKIVNTLKTIQSMDARELYKKTEDIRKHNKNNFFNKIEMSKSINQTVLNFFTLYDQ